MRRYVIALVALLALAGCSSNDPKIEDAAPSTPNVSTEGGDSNPQEPNSGPDGPAKFGQTYAYEDGLKITITKIVRRGSGVVFTIRLQNGTTDVLDATEVSVNAAYGKDGNQAEPGYDLNSDDAFQGKVTPKHSKSATFSFSIPRSGLSDVLVEVYPTYDDDPATFEGAIK